MAIRIGCSLIVPPSKPTNKSSFPKKPSQLSICSEKKSGEEGPRRLPCAVAAIVIGLEMAIMSSASPISYVAETRYDAVQGEGRALPAAAETASSHSQPPRARVAPPPKWSDTIRACPAWRVNSLESIVPENLPRPSARRGAETARFAAAAGEAPPVKLSVQRATAGGCFNM